MCPTWILRFQGEWAVAVVPCGDHGDVPCIWVFMALFQWGIPGGVYRRVARQAQPHRGTFVGWPGAGGLGAALFTFIAIIIALAVHLDSR